MASGPSSTPATTPRTGPALGLGPPPAPPACSWAAWPCTGTAVPTAVSPLGHAMTPSRLHVIWVHRSALPLPVQWYSCLLWGVLGGMLGGALGGVLGGSLGLVVSKSTAGAAAGTIGGAIGQSQQTDIDMHSAWRMRE